MDVKEEEEEKKQISIFHFRWFWLEGACFRNVEIGVDVWGVFDCMWKSECHINEQWWVDFWGFVPSL